MSTPISTASYTIGMPDIYFCSDTVTNNTVTTASAYTDLEILLSAIAIDGSTADRASYSLGNLAEASLTPEYTTLDHFISSNGSRLKDKSIITEKNLTLTLSFDEISITNLKRFLMAGTDGDGTAGAVMENVAAEGSAVLVMRTAYGNPFLYAIPRCALIANGDMAFSGEDWMKGGLKINILALTGFNPNSASFLLTHGNKPAGITSAPYGYIQTQAAFGTFYYTTA